jgi:D-glycero-D-manno-heptose 1,7-bisphosphate phosphatase
VLERHSLDGGILGSLTGATDDEHPPDNEKNKRKAVFLDRDGVLNRDSPDFIKSPDELHMIPGSPMAVARLNQAGYLTIVISNQSGVARGLVSEEALEAMHRKLCADVETAGGKITDVYYCPHMPGEGCPCRKPSPGMIIQACADYNIDQSRSYLVGDKVDDITCGAAAGCKTILVLTGQTLTYDPTEFYVQPDRISRDLDEACAWILSQS